MLHRNPMPVGDAAYRASAAEPAALVLLGVGAVLLLYALALSLFSRRIALGSSSSRAHTLETNANGSAAVPSEDDDGQHAMHLFGLEESDFETEEEKLLAHTSVGKAVDEDEFRDTVRRKVFSLVLVAILQLALHAATAFWFLSAHPEAKLPFYEATGRAVISLLTILLVFRRHRVSAWRLAGSLTTASLLSLGSYLLTLVVAPEFRIFPDDAIRTTISLSARSMPSSINLLAWPSQSSTVLASLGPARDWAREHERALTTAGVVVFHVVNLLLAVLASAFSSTLPLAPLRVYQPTPTSPPSAMLAQGQLGGDSIFLRATHLYMTPVISFARRNGGLDADNVPYLHAELRSIMLFLRFRRAWRTRRDRNAGKQTTPGTLLRAMLWTSRREILVVASIGWISAALFYLPSMCINRFVFVWERQEQLGGERDVRTGLVWALLMFVVAFSQSILMGISLTMCFSTLRSKLKQEFGTLLFSKALRRQEISAPAAESKDDDEVFSSKAAVMTLISSDVDRIVKVGQYILNICLLPFECMIGFYYVYRLMGLGAVIGLAASLLMVPIINLLGKLNARFNEALQKARDKRVTFLNEAIEAIRMIKFSAWEERIMDRILVSRRREIVQMRKVFACEAAQQTTAALSPTIVIIVSIFYASLVDGKKMTPSVVFTAVAVLNELRFALTELPSLIQSFIELWVSLKRIAAFLNTPELALPKNAPPSDLSAPPAVSASAASVAWPSMTPDAAAFRLDKVTFSLVPGRVNLVCGKVGAGKSMLLLALLGELDLTAGTIECPRSHPGAIGGVLAPKFISPAEWLRSDLVAYVPQQAWLINASLRDNILWGLPMDEGRYQATLKACGLLPDLQILEDGDLTDIGEQGVGLSGGQKTRVSLARAVYSRARLLLMDSPLSNVDAHTAEFIKEHLFEGELVKGRTIVLVTHQLALLSPLAAKIVLMDAGSVVFEGDADALLSSNLYSSLLAELKNKDDTEPVEAESQPSSQPTSGSATPATTATAETTPATSKAPSINEEEVKPVIKEARKVIKEESRQRGTVKWATYKAWVDALGGWPVFMPVFLIFVAYTGWDLVSGLILRSFSGDALRQHPTHEPMYWMVWYASSLSFGSLLAGIAFISLYLISLRAAMTLFKGMLRAVFHATLRTHDTIPKGRFLNRFSSDVESSDQMLPEMIGQFFWAIGSVLFGMTALTIGGGGRFIWALLLLSPIYFRIASMYRTVTRDLRRLEAASKSPITTSFSDLLSGAVVVRAFGASARMMDALLTKSDESVRFMWVLSQATRWTVFHYQMLSASLVLAGNLSLLFNPATTSSSVGFAASAIVSTDFLLMFSLMCFSNLEQKAVSTERIIEYQSLPAEGSESKQSPPEGWPAHGRVDIENLSIQYAPDLPTILHGISVTIPPAAKVGVVGKTGSGKSTLASSFFRFTEAAGGRVLIDGVDIAGLDIQKLRSNLLIVPQDPILLSGTLREALDPFAEYSDEQVREALRGARLVPEDDAESPFRNLEYPIAEGGSNLSGGQRQLLCLARALLRKSRVVFFDEASSALDSETDAAIAATIRQAFHASTVITIAHRLRTIADFDLVLVLDKGKVVEFDRPGKLIDDPTSYFHKLCKAAGRKEFNVLRNMAQQ